MSLTPHQTALLHARFRRETLLSLGTHESLHGKEVCTIIIEAMLDACALHLHGSVGPKETFEVFDKRTNAIGGILIEQAARNQ